MNPINPTLIHTQSGLSELKLFCPLSRTPHGLLDMATTALAALLWLGAVPAAESRRPGSGHCRCRRYRTTGRMEALAIFNSASYYPLTLLAVVVIAACT
ncbi:MAG: hypothetical protein ACYC5X_10605 [Syntrophales bacterium]